MKEKNSSIDINNQLMTNTLMFKENLKLIIISLSKLISRLNLERQIQQEEHTTDYIKSKSGDLLREI